MRTSLQGLSDLLVGLHLNRHNGWTWEDMPLFVWDEESDELPPISNLTVFHGSTRRTPRAREAAIATLGGGGPPYFPPLPAGKLMHAVGDPDKASILIIDEAEETLWHTVLSGRFAPFRAHTYRIRVEDLAKEWRESDDDLIVEILAFLHTISERGPDFVDVTSSASWRYAKERSLKYHKIAARRSGYNPRQVAFPPGIRVRIDPRLAWTPPTKRSLKP